MCAAITPEDSSVSGKKKGQSHPPVRPMSPRTVNDTRQLLETSRLPRREIYIAKRTRRAADEMQARWLHSRCRGTPFVFLLAYEGKKH